MEYTQEDFVNSLKELEQKYRKDKEDINRIFATKNNPYKIGDIVTDHIGTLLIEKIQFKPSYNANLPQCVFKGLELKKDGTPKIRQDKNRRIYQDDIILK